VETTSAEQRPNADILVRLQAGHAAKEIPGLRRRILDSPVDFNACYLLSLALASLGDRRAERSWMERSLILAPENAHVQTSFGIARLRDRDIERARTAFDEAIKYSPNFAPARYNRALIELEATHFSRGWADYEWRFSYPAAPGVWRDFPSPVWDGVSPLEGKLLVWAEQSHSSQIMFTSVLREFDPPDGLVVEADAGLVPLLRRSLPKAEVVAVADPPDRRLSGRDIAANIPMGRLCGLRRRSITAFRKARHNFLEADAERAIDLMLDLAKPDNRTIGLSWRALSKSDAGLSLAQLEPVLRVPDVTWVSLEDETALPEILAFEESTGIHISTDHGVDTVGDLDGLAALISACELVVSVDRPSTHLAGAIGRNVWTLLPSRHRARWYWFSGHRARPPKFASWYRSMRLVWKRDEEPTATYTNRVANLVRGALDAS
jgi:hypothetical protein